jgi:flavodoxin
MNGSGRGTTDVVHVLVAYDTRYGNTQRLAEALARGFRSVPGVEVDCVNIAQVDPGDLDQYSVIGLGAPTESHSASAPMKAFLTQVGLVSNLRGMRAFAFETRVAGPLAGSAGGYIEHHLARFGVPPLRPYLSAIVRPMTRPEHRKFGDESDPEWMRHPGGADIGKPPLRPEGPDLLAPGTEEEFARAGAELARTLVPVPVLVRP